MATITITDGALIGRQGLWRAEIGSGSPQNIDVMKLADSVGGNG